VGDIYGESTAGSPVSVLLDVNGGNGGGSANGRSGDGAAVTLSNAIDGTTSGSLQLTQIATGGSAGSVDDNAGINGVAGGAVSSLSKSGSFTNVTIETSASGGHGSGRNGTGAPGAGAAATATSLANNDAGSGSASATAEGGYGGYSNAPGQTDAAGGLGQGTASAIGATSATAAAKAIGGFGGTHGGANAAAMATGFGAQNAVSATGSAEGGAGVATAEAITSGGAIIRGHAMATAPVASTGSIRSRSDVLAYGNIGLGLPDDSFGREAVAAFVSHPETETLNSALAGKAAVTAALAGHDTVALALLGGAYALASDGSADDASGDQFTFTSTIELTLASPSENDILLGLLDPVTAGDGFDELRFQVFGETNPLLDVNFTDLASAVAYFDDNVIDLGHIFVGPDGNLDLSFQLDLIGTAAGSGFYFDFVASTAAVPLPASVWLILTAFGVLGPYCSRNRRS
jgi:hypothetical protein